MMSHGRLRPEPPCVRDSYFCCAVAEYSSICAVRSIGYEIFTSVIVPVGVHHRRQLRHHEARCRTGSFSFSTRATTSSRSFASKWMP